MNFDGFWVVALYLYYYYILFFPFSSPPFFIIYYYYYYVRGRERKESQKMVWFSEFHIQVGFADMQVAGFGKSGLCPQGSSPLDSSYLFLSLSVTPFSRLSLSLEKAQFSSEKPTSHSEQFAKKICYFFPWMRNERLCVTGIILFYNLILITICHM